jgi:hypothetical protein
MAIVINEFEALPAPSAASAPVVQSPERGAVSPLDARELDRVLRLRAERALRVRAY